MSTLFITHQIALGHDMGPGHPEQPDRLRAIERALEQESFQMLARDRAQRARWSRSPAATRRRISSALKRPRLRTASCIWMATRP